MSIEQVISWFGLFILFLAVVNVMLPPKYDVAIRLREWLSR